MRVFLISTFIVFLILSCSDKIKQKEKDILKYEYLTPFVLKGQNFINGNLDIDNNHLIYSYEVFDVVGELNRINNQAITEGWERRKNGYSKYIPIYDNSGETIYLSITTIGNKIEFNVSSE
jgi:hypothetical protein